MIYYNEFDRKAAAWLRELMADGLIPKGVVDERSINDVRPDELKGFIQCHFFAGIGGWAYALRLAGWPEDKPVWTASCPCQPFSQAGKGLGTKDPRHLWPVFRRLVGRCKPATVFGEQVASAAGRIWLAGVRANLARLGYAVGAADLCAAGVGSPQIRQRLYWGASRVANATDSRHVGSRQGNSGTWRPSCLPCDSIETERLGNSDGSRPQGHGTTGRNSDTGGANEAGHNRNSGFWHDAIWHNCSDGKARRISPQPEIFPLAHGVSGRVGLLRGAGNAIVPQLAAEFIQAFQEITG